jgi:hypothetical protein
MVGAVITGTNPFIGIVDAPLQHLRAAERRADYRNQPFDPQV